MASYRSRRIMLCVSAICTVLFASLLGTATWSTICVYPSQRTIVFTHEGRLVVAWYSMGSSRRISPQFIQAWADAPAWLWWAPTWESDHVRTWCVLPLWWPVVAAGSATLVIWFKRRKAITDPSACAVCGYPITSSPRALTCPECGNRTRSPSGHGGQMRAAAHLATDGLQAEPPESIERAT